jgi:hypothetical protein
MTSSSDSGPASRHPVLPPVAIVAGQPKASAALPTSSKVAPCNARKGCPVVPWKVRTNPYLTTGILNRTRSEARQQQTRARETPPFAAAIVTRSLLAKLAEGVDFSPLFSSTDEERASTKADDMDAEEARVLAEFEKTLTRAHGWCAVAKSPLLQRLIPTDDGN